MQIEITSCTGEQLPEILAIFNDSIRHSTALYEYNEMTGEDMERWYAAKTSGGFPLVGAFGNSGELLGFATFGTFRPRPAYGNTIEHSVYIRKDKRGLGLGKMLLKHIIDRATEMDYHTMIGVIDASNSVSVRLHESLGFELAGKLREVGL